DDLSEVPALMRVPSPGQDISRTHLLVSPDDWEIRLTDLHSTNGTLIVRPGPGVERLQLQPGEPYAVVVGTVVELGDGVAVLVDGPPRPGS
ncbi:MAG TPA: FHA domain-containing protein, partial [Microlunatus sp.]